MDVKRKNFILFLVLIALAGVALFGFGKFSLKLGINKEKAITVGGLNQPEKIESSFKPPSVPENNTINLEPAPVTTPELEIKVEKKELEDQPVILGVYKIIAGEKGYAPSSLAVRKNQIITISLVSSHSGKADFFIPDMGIYLWAEETPRTTSFRVPEKGTYEFRCRDFCPTIGEIKGLLVVKDF